VKASQSQFKPQILKKQTQQTTSEELIGENHKKVKNTQNKIKINDKRIRNNTQETKNNKV
jgi:predicted kinase